MLSLGVLLVFADLVSNRRLQILPWLTVAGTLLCMGLLYANQGGESFGGMFQADSYSFFFKNLILISVIFTSLISERYLPVVSLRNGEYYSLLVFAAVGMMFMASAADLVLLYMGLELMALSVYCMVGLLKQETRSNEAALKYFLMGAFSSGLLLYGISLVYGMTGTTKLVLLAQRLTELGITENPALLAGVGLILAAFLFKVAAVPFHMWTPDVYEGAPTSVTAFMSVGPKAASFAVLGRVFFLAFSEVHIHWGPILACIALFTMGIGNIMALSQKSIKRMLAYSAIAHAGYALLGVLAGTSEGLSATMNYLLVYAFMNMGAFGIIIMLCQKEQRGEDLEDYRGLAKQHPMVAALMLIFMFSLTGIPPTAGFVGKFYLFMAAINAGYTGVVIVAVVFSAISAYFYLRVVRYMYMLDPEKDVVVNVSPGLSTALVLSVIGVLGLGLVPGSILHVAAASIIGH